MQNKAFSLVELSIVLVILGLLVGGILAGQSLIRAAELRSISNQSQTYNTAVHSFRDKYFALPGDMSNAVRFWGAQAGPTTDGYNSTCGILTTAATTPATCNGNGDNTLNTIGGYYSEMFRFWQHLANAGLIEGNYAGVTDTGNALDSTVGFNIPSSRIPNAGFAIWYVAFAAPTAYFDSGVVGKHLMLFGGERAGNPGVPVLAPEEAWNIDTKMDDGLPGQGRVINYRSDFAVTPNCTTTTNPATATYNLGNSTKLCSMIFLPGY